MWENVGVAHSYGVLLSLRDVVFFGLLKPSPSKYVSNPELPITVFPHRSVIKAVLLGHLQGYKCNRWSLRVLHPIRNNKSSKIFNYAYWAEKEATTFDAGLSEHIQRLTWSLLEKNKPSLKKSFKIAGRANATSYATVQNISTWHDVTGTRERICFFTWQFFLKKFYTKINKISFSVYLKISGNKLTAWT